MKKMTPVDRQPRTPLWRSLRRALAAGLALGLAACSSLAPRVDPDRQTAFMKDAGAKRSAAELRQRVDSMVAPILAFIEASMDQVRAEATDPEVRRRALLFKIESVPVVYRAAFQPDPLAGIVDLWLLAYQVEECFDRGEDQCQLGDQQDLGRRFSRKMREGFEKEVLAFSGDTEAVRRMQKEVEAVAARHPLRGPIAIANRHTMTDELAAVLGSEARDAFDLIGDVSLTLAELSSRLNTYVGDVGRLARWHAELLTEDLLQKPEIADGLEGVGRVDEISRSLEALEETLGPEGVELLVAEILKQVSRERSAILADVERQRVQVQGFVSAERALVLEAVSRQRVAVLEGVHRERVEALAEVDQLVSGYLDATTERALTVVDHLVWRLAQLLGGLLVLAALLAWLVLRGRGVTLAGSSRPDGRQP